MKKTVKKITAVLTGATMLGATIMGAAAMDLGDYPEPLIVDGVWNGKLVFGANAAAEDIAGAAALAANLQKYSRVPVSLGSGVISVEGGYEFEDQGLNAAFPSANLELDDRDLEGLKSTTIRWDSENIRVSEIVEIRKENLTAVTSINNGKFEEYGVNTYLNFERDAILYKYVFDDQDVDNVTIAGGEELVIEFLGRTIEISAIDDDEMTLETASLSGFLSRGDTWTMEGNTIEVITIHSTGVLLEVGGVRRNLGNAAGSRVEWSDLDLVVETSEHIYVEDEPEFNSVELKAGEDITKTVSRLSAMEIFGEDEDDPEWIWDWNLEVDKLDYIGAKLDIGRSLTPDEVEYDDERPALGYGDSLMLPNDYGAITFEGYYDDGSNEINMYFREMRLLNESDDRTESAKFLVISSDSDRGPFRFGDNIRADEIYIAAAYADGNLSIGYEEAGERKWYNNSMGNFTGNVSVELVRGQNDVYITSYASGADNMLTFVFGDESLTFNLTDYTEFEDDYLLYKVTGGSDVPLGEEEYGVRLTYGVYFEDPESMIDRDRFDMHVPHEPAEVVVVVSGPGTVTHIGEDGTAYETVPIPGADLSVLDSEAMGLIGEVPMLVVGGPNANTVAAELLEVEQFSEEILELFEANKAMIKLFEEQNAILVAGYGAKDTRAASLALANEDNWADFAGYKEVELTIPATTVTSIVGK